MAQKKAIKESFRQKALPHMDALWHTALWLTKSGADAEDLVESTFIEAYRIWDESISRDESKAWIFRIMIKRLLKNTKLSFRAVVRHSIDSFYEPVQPEDIAAIKDIPRDIVTEAIKRLPIESRLLLVLSLFEKFTYQEIADIIGIQKRTVRSKVYQGYMLMRKELYRFIASGNLYMPAN